MTIVDLLKIIDAIPGDWILAPYGQFHGVMDGSWIPVFNAHFKREYRYRDSKKPYSYSGELRSDGGGPQLDMVVVYAQAQHKWRTEKEYGNEPD